MRALEELGADTRAVDKRGNTAAAHAQSWGHPLDPRIRAWLRRTCRWGALHRACANRAGEALIVGLLRGGADPARRSPAGETPLSICRNEDLEDGSLPADAATTAIIEAALMPCWHPKRHRLFPDSFRSIVVAVVLLQQRLERRAEQMGAEEEAAAAAGEVDGSDEQHARRAGRLSVVLPLELWLQWVVPALPRMPSGQRSCAYCGAASRAGGVKFKRCAGCKAAWYCCKRHQVAHWKAKECGHKKACKARQKEARRAK